jgi:hypothetical protein
MRDDGTTTDLIVLFVAIAKGSNDQRVPLRTCVVQNLKISSRRSRISV